MTVADRFEEEAREVLASLYDGAFDNTPGSVARVFNARKLSAALRKAEARVWREAAGMLVPGDHRAQQFIERAEKLEKGE